MNITDLSLKLFQIPEVDENILKSSFNVSMNKYLASSKFSVGFNYYIHQSYDNFIEIIKKQNKKTFYWVVNGFEVLLNDEEKKNELINKMELYFDKTGDFKNIKYAIMWDILMINDIMGKDSKIYYNGDKIIEDVINNYYKKIGKIMNKSSVISFSDKSYDTAIIDNDFDFNTKEAESLYFKNILSDTNQGLIDLKKDGNMIIRIGDIYTDPTIKLIMLLKSLFKYVYIYKPYYSRSVDSEKYIICKEFNKSTYNNIATKLEKSIKLIKDNQDKFVTDILSDMPILKEVETVITFINLYFSGIQHREKNKIIKYIESENYFGTEYQDYLDRQLKCTEYFSSKFFPLDKNDYIEIQKENLELINKNIQLIKEFNKKNILMI